jgi:hypothetical protein
MSERRNPNPFRPIPVDDAHKDAIEAFLAQTNGPYGAQPGVTKTYAQVVAVIAQTLARLEELQVLVRDRAYAEVEHVGEGSGRFGRHGPSHMVVVTRIGLAFGSNGTVKSVVLTGAAIERAWPQAAQKLHIRLEETSHRLWLQRLASKLGTVADRPRRAPRLPVPRADAEAIAGAFPMEARA